jgi:4-hydroxy-tetrahydrodipicolinate synthase
MGTSENALQDTCQVGVPQVPCSRFRENNEFMFKGSIVALVTPFDEAGEIDYSALSSIVTFHLQAGTDALVIAGTTGESATLLPGEFEALLSAVIGQVAGQIPVIVGTGSASTWHTIESTCQAATLGADGVLVVTPYYNRPTHHGLVEHFTAVANASKIPVVLYNVPSRTALDMLPETVAELANHEQIVALKEAVAGKERVQQLKSLCGNGFTILSGDDHSCLEAMQAGASGVISVAANVVPARFSVLCRAAAAGDWDLASTEEAGLRQLFDILMIETNPIPVKWALYGMSHCSPFVRLPLTPLSNVHHEKLERCLAALGVLNS